MTRYSSVSAAELIRTCAESTDGAAWEEFVFRFHRPISLSVFRTVSQWGEIPGPVVDDLVQETYLKLCSDRFHALLGFANAHPDAIGGYVKTIAVNTVHDYFKSRHSQKRGSGRRQQSVEEVDAVAASESLGSPERMEREVLLNQIDQCIRACSAGPDQERDRLMFWLYYQQGMSAKAIALLPTIGLSAKGVESAILRLTRLVREQIVVIRTEGPGSAGPNQKGLRTAESY